MTVEELIDILKRHKDENPNVKLHIKDNELYWESPIKEVYKKPDDSGGCLILSNEDEDGNFE